MLGIFDVAMQGAVSSRLGKVFSESLLGGTCACFATRVTRLSGGEVHSGPSRRRELADGKPHFLRVRLVGYVAASDRCGRHNERRCECERFEDQTWSSKHG